MLRPRTFLGLLFVICLAVSAQGQEAKNEPVAFTPLTLSLAAEPGVITHCAGDSRPAIVQLNATGTAIVGNPVRYNWRTTAGRIEGEGPTVNWNLTGVVPGQHKVFLDIINGSTNEECQAFSSTTILVNCAPPVCPNVSIVCPDRVVVDEPITFSANLSGGSGSVDSTYNWTVSAGTIIEGQGTPTIKVDTKGLAGQTVKATFSVGGYPRDCSAVCVVQIPLPKKNCRKFDEFPDIQRNDEKARLDNLAIELQNDPAVTAYVYVYPGAKSHAGVAQARTSRILDYLVNTREIDSQRVVTIVGPTRPSFMVEIWLCPPGTTPPRPGK